MIYTSQRPLLLYSLICKEKLVHKGRITFFDVQHSLAVREFPLNLPELSLHYAFLCGIDPATLTIQISSNLPYFSSRSILATIPRQDAMPGTKIYTNCYTLPPLLIPEPMHFEFVFQIDDTDIYRYPFWIELAPAKS